MIRCSKCLNMKRKCMCTFKKNAGSTVLLAVAFFVTAVITMLPANIYAAGGVSISNAPSVQMGETFTVTVTYSKDNLARVSGMLTYDPDIITYISGGSSSGNGGAVQLKRSADEGKVLFTLQFKAVKKGESSLKVKTGEMYNLDEQLISDCPSASAIVTVTSSTDGNQKKYDAGVRDKNNHKNSNEKTDNKREYKVNSAKENKKEGPLEKGISDRVKIFSIIASSGLAILAVNLIIIKAKRKKQK